VFFLSFIRQPVAGVNNLLSEFSRNFLKRILKITAERNFNKSSYQVCYDVMVTFHMFPHTDSLGKKPEREQYFQFTINLQYGCFNNIIGAKAGECRTKDTSPHPSHSY